MSDTNGPDGTSYTDNDGYEADEGNGAAADGGGAGKEGTIPESDDGIAVALGADSNFEPEEDEEVDPRTQA
jgi:hypothetical protein